MKATKSTSKTFRQRRTRSKVKGTTDRPRLCVTRSLRVTYAQLIDDQRHMTIASGDTRALAQGKSKIDQAHALGVLIAEKGKKLGVSTIVFDRGGNRYHGRVRAVADGAREGGLVF